MEVTASQTRRPRAMIAACLFLAVVCLYLPSLGHRFVTLDDGLYVTDNRVVQGGLTRGGFVWAFRSYHSANWHPVTWLSHMLDCELFGLNPAGHHLTSVLLHGTNAALLFLLLNLMTGSLWRSAFASLLFGLHPVNVESVAWIAERKNVLSTTFWFLTMLAYWGYARRPSVTRTIPVIGLFALGLMAKPMLVTLPFALLLLDVWPLRRALVPGGVAGSAALSRGRATRLLVEKLPLLALASISCVVTVAAQRSGGALAALDQYSVPHRLLNTLVSYAAYLVNLAWPSRLAVFYPFSVAIAAWKVLASAAVLASVCLLSARHARESPWLPVGWLWYLGTLIPVIGIVQVGSQAMADRYLYIPGAGLFIIAAWIAGATARRGPRARFATTMVALVALGLCAVATRAQLATWEDSVSLYRQALAATGPSNYRAHYGLGVALAAEEDLQGAAASLREAVMLAPSFVDARTHLGLVYVKLGELSEAERQFLAGLDVAPRNPFLLQNMGALRDLTGRTDEAIVWYRRALLADSGNISARNRLASTRR